MEKTPCKYIINKNQKLTMLPLISNKGEEIHDQKE